MYSVVNMKEDSARGDIIQKNILLDDSISERLTATF
jgi:hypothetical protein